MAHNLALNRINPTNLYFLVFLVYFPRECFIIFNFKNKIMKSREEEVKMMKITAITIVHYTLYYLILCFVTPPFGSLPREIFKL